MTWCKALNLYLPHKQPKSLGVSYLKKMNKNLLKILESIADDKYDGCFEIIKTKVGYTIAFPFQYKDPDELQLYDNIEDAIINLIQENLKHYKDENI